MSYQSKGAAGGPDRRAPNLVAQVHPSKPEHTPDAASRQQASAVNGRLQRINARAAQIAHDEALRDAKRALHAREPWERQELRASSATLLALSRSLRLEVTR